MPMGLGYQKMKTAGLYLVPIKSYSRNIRVPSLLEQIVVMVLRNLRILIEYEEQAHTCSIQLILFLAGARVTDALICHGRGHIQARIDMTQP